MTESRLMSELHNYTDRKHNIDLGERRERANRCTEIQAYGDWDRSAVSVTTLFVASGIPLVAPEA